MDELDAPSFGRTNGYSLLVVEDNMLMREMLRTIIEAIDHVVWFGGCASVAEAKNLLAGEVHPDLILLDITLPDGSGLEVLETSHVQSGRSKVAFATGREDEHALSLCLKFRLAGYIDKLTSHLKDWRDAIHCLSQGRSYFSASIQAKLASLQARSDHWSRVLTRREMEITPYLARGMGNQEVADQFGLSPQTVQVHRKRIMHKLDVHSTPELMERARQTGLRV